MQHFGWHSQLAHFALNLVELVYFMYPLLLISFLAFPAWISVADAALAWAASGPVGAGLVFADLV